jgi:hypothetical protein
MALRLCILEMSHFHKSLFLSCIGFSIWSAKRTRMANMV